MSEHTKMAQSSSSTPPMTLSELPSADTKRWGTACKAKVVNAVRSGLISLEDACRRYALSVDEFVSWQSLMDQHGVAALRVTRTHQFRKGR